MYGERQRHKQVENAIADYLSRGEVASVTMDTLHNDNSVKLETVTQYENLVGRMDAVITTRLHGLVFALKRGVPAVAIDAIAGGAKVTAQANAIGWPLILKGEAVNADEISVAVNLCLNGKMSSDVIRARRCAIIKLQRVKSEFLDALRERESLASSEKHA
jgi:polysaccharide pyruvyl transferase WcaK-like protein